MARVDLNEPLAASKVEGNNVNPARNFPRFFRFGVGDGSEEVDAIVVVGNVRCVCALCRVT